MNVSVIVTAPFGKGAHVVEKDASGAIVEEWTIEQTKSINVFVVDGHSITVSDEPAA